MVPSPRSSECLELLAAVEAHWRHALSLVAGDEPVAAAREVERAGDEVEELLRQTRALPPEESAGILREIRALGPLYRELLKQSEAGRTRIGQEIAGVHEGGRTLRAYSSGRTSGRGYSKVL